MELIIDRDFLDNFFLSDTEDIYHEDLKLFFKKLSNCKIITNYNSLEEFIKEAEESNPILHYFIETNVPEIEFRENLNADVKKEDFYNDGSPIKLFFLENISSNITSNFGFSNINTSSISEKWIPFYNGRNEEFNILKTSKDRTLKRHERFEKWEDLRGFEHPIHSIVIADRYLLVNKKDQKVENNLFPLLKNLIGKNTLGANIDLLIITHELKGSLKKTYEEVDTFLKERLKLKKYHFALVINPPGKKFEHFRRIYSNYFSIVSENSLNVFKDNGSYHDKNNNLTFKFHFNDKNFRFVSKELRDISNWLSKVKNREKIGFDSEKTYYYPDKSNKLLDSFR